MVEALEVGKEVISEPFKWLLLGVLKNIVFPNKAVLWIVQRVKLIPKKTL